MLVEIPDPRFTMIDVRAFRGLHNVRLEGLSRVNIIVGPNNTGKTSVLEAIEACCHPINADAWLDMIRRRGSRQPLGEQFAGLFPMSTNDKENDMAPKDLCILYERLGEPSAWKVFGQLWRINRLISDDMDPDNSDVDNSLASPTRLVTRASLQIVPTTTEVVESAPPGARFFDDIGVNFEKRTDFELRTGGRIPKAAHSEDVTTVSISPIAHRSEVFQIMLMAYDAPAFRHDVIELLKEFDPGVAEIEVYDPEGTRSYLRVWHKRTGYMPIAAFGDGFRRVLTYALAVIKCRNGGVLLIDEVETAIHYSALRNVYRWLVKACAEHRVQLFVTTHSLEAIDALLEATPDEVDTSFYRLHEQDGNIQVVRFDEAELRTLREEFGDEVRG